MLDDLKTVFAAAKDRMLENAASAMLNRYLEGIGTVTRMEVNSREKTLTIELALKGESSTVTLKAGRYEVSGGDGESDAWITLHDCQASREWISAALFRYVEGQRLKIPPQLKLVL